MISKIKNNYKSYLIWGSVFFFSMLYLSLIFNHNIWTDEAFTLELIQGNLKEIVEGTANDVHPPLYYFWSKLFYLFFGLNLQAQKIAAMIPMIGTLVYAATVIRKKFGDLTSFLSIIFLSCIPCSMEFAVQVRMYSLALLFVTVCGVSAYLAFAEDGTKEWILYVICALGAAYTHYFAFVSVIYITGFLLIAILIRKRQLLKKWLISSVCMILLYLPWFGPFITQVTRVRTNYWIPEITPEIIWSYFTWTFDLELVPGVVYGFLLILILTGIANIVMIIKKKEQFDIYALLCMLIPTVTVISGILISLTKSPIYRDQYIFPSLGLLSLFFAITLRKADKKILIPILAFLLFVGALQYKECFRQEYRSTYVPQTDEFFKENLKEDDYIVYNWDTFGFIYRLYFPNDQLYYLDDFDFSQNYNTVWFINTKWSPQIDQSILDANGLSMELMGHYGIEHNEFDIYMIYRDEFTNDK